MSHLPVFFRPGDAWVGDVIPFERDGIFWLFYLYDVRTTPKPGTSWHLVRTSDFVTFEDCGVALTHGTTADADFNAYTGSIATDAQGTDHLFYTGQNPSRLGADGLPLQVVMHATSDDGMRTWHKHPERAFGAPAGYESGDWRDPLVFWDADDNRWRMLLAARHTAGPDRRRGVIAQCVSNDLVSWEPADPFWDPRRYITHECPDIFSWGDWWYLVYSEFSESFTTRYRMARTVNGPWSTPTRDSVDGRAFYAAKSAERDGRRFFVGWIATRADAGDDGAFEWAGTMSVLEARQNPDGTLGFAFPRELSDSFDAPVATDFGQSLPVVLEAADGYRAALATGLAPAQFYARVTLAIAAGTTECGLLLRATPDGDESYILRLEPKRHRLVFDRWPRKVHGDAQWHVSGDVPFDIALERPCDLSVGIHTLEVIVDGDICVAVVDQQVALSTRIYDRIEGQVGVFAGEGCATVLDFVLRQRSNA